MPASLRAICADITRLTVDAIVNAPREVRLLFAQGHAGLAASRRGIMLDALAD